MRYRHHVAMLGVAGLWGLGLPATAEVTLDGSMPGSVDGTGAIKDVPFDGTTWNIQEAFGELSGSNLYHSFDLFSIDTGERASFRSDEASLRVIARVTGGFLSDIDGRLEIVDSTTLEPIQDADLFLLNPSGVMFGPNATVQRIAGSFYASTADVLRFPDGPAFDLPTGVTSLPPVLSTMEPAAFGFLVDDPAPIVLTRTGGSPLQLSEGESFGLVGGDITIAGVDNLDVRTIQIDGGRIELASVRSAGSDGVFVPRDVASFDVGSFAPDELGEILLLGRTVLDVGSGTAVGAGSVVIRGGRFEMSNDLIDVRSENAIAGAERAIDVEVAGLSVGGEVEGVLIHGGTRLDSRSNGAAPSGAMVFSGPRVEVADAGTRILSIASGSQGPAIRLEGDDIRVRDSALLWSAGLSASDTGGAVELDAGTTGSVTLSGGGQVLSQARSGGPGGAVRVDARELHVEGAGTQITSETISSGAGGAMWIDVEQQAVVADQSQIGSLSSSTGPGGSLTMTAGSLVVDGRAQILSDAQSTGPGGPVDIDVEGALDVTNLGKIVALASAAAGAPGGSLEVSAAAISVTSVDTAFADASQISALTEGDAPGGSLTVQAASIDLGDGGQLRTTTSGGGGDAGLLLVEGRPGQRLASIEIGGTVDAGGETIQAGIFARALGDGTADPDDGNGGRIRIDAAEVDVGLGGVISSRTFEDGNAGDLDIENADLVRIRGGEVSAKGSGGAGGDLTIATDVLEVTEGGNASASTLGTGGAGKVEVTARTVLVSGTDAGGANRSGLFAQTTFPTADSGDSGSVVLTATESVVVDDDGRISVESRGGGFAGDIEIAGPAGGELGLLEVRNGAEISALVRDTRAPTSPDDNVTADVLIERVARVEIDAATITAETRGSGAGGDIEFGDVGAIDIADGLVTAETSGAGDGGTVRIGRDEAGALRPVEYLRMASGTISAETNGPDEGKAGNIEIATTQGVTLLDGARITARSTSNADAGEIDIDAGRFFVAAASSPLPGEGGMVTTEATGDDASGGQITIRASDLVYLSDARIETNVSKGLSAGEGGDPALGDGGNFSIPDAPDLVVLNRSRIVASAEQGSGGNILITGTFLPSDRLLEDEDFATRSDSVLDATSDTDPGEVVITSPDSDLAGQLTPLPIAYFDASRMMMTPCAARRARAGSFVVQTQAAEPPPDAPLTASAARDAVPDATLYEWERESCPD